jgi:hypothetical protein
MDLQIFVVFHKNIFEECYQHIPEDILYRYFTFYAVNENIEKVYPSKYKIIKEWELPVYDKSFQERGYNENSALYHIYANQLHKPYYYIGFFQYDMMFGPDFIDKMIKPISAPSIFYVMSESFDVCAYQTWNEAKTLNFVIRDYENFYKTTFNDTKIYPLLNSYIIPTDTYERVMMWVVQLYDKIYPWCVEFPNQTHFCHIGGIYERVMAFAIGQEPLQYTKLDIFHNRDYKALSY